MSTHKHNLPEMLERGRLSGKLAIGGLVLSGILTLTVFIAGPVYGWSGIRLFTMGMMPFLLAFVFSLMALIQAKFFVKTVAEEEEKRLLEKRKENVSSILDVAEDVRFTAKRTLINFEKYAPSVVSVICFLASVIWLYSFYTEGQAGAATGDTIIPLIPKNPINLAFLCVICAGAAFFGGVFMVGQSHVREFRYMRPAGAWLICGAVVMALCGLAGIMLYYGKEAWELDFEKVVFFVYAILTIEFLWNFVVEFYRPRTRRDFRPVYESRLLALFTEPGGVVRNLARTLDYQFGFELSKTSLYLFIRKYFVPALLVWGGVFWLFTGIAEVSTGELGIRERFGAASSDKSVLEPGVHLKMPWPFERIVKVPVGTIQEVVVGSKVNESEKNMNASVILWDGMHYKHGTAFLVATKRIGADVSNSVAHEYPLSLLEVSLPVYFRAKASEAYNYAFGFKDINTTILSIGEAEATRYFASSNFTRDISDARAEISEILKERIQKSCDDMALGVEIVSVGMHDAHPPVGEKGQDGRPLPESTDVASAFQDVVCAAENAIGAEYAAKAEADRIVTSARIGEMTLLSDAASYSNAQKAVAEAEANRFKSQLVAYNAMPLMFELNTYLAMLREASKDTKMYIISSDITSRIFEFNFEEQGKLDLTNTDLSKFGK